jgi:hypothetical protein
VISIHDVRKPLRAVVSDAIARGCWTLEKTGRKNGHTMRLRHKSGRLVPLHCSTVSEALASKKLGSQLRRIERELTGRV